VIAHPARLTLLHLPGGNRPPNWRAAPTRAPGTGGQHGIGAAKLACDNARNGLLGCVRPVSAQVLPGYGVSVAGSVTPMVGVGAGGAVVGVGGPGGEVVGGAGLLVVGAGAALLVVGAGAGAVGPAVGALGLGKGFAGPTVAVGDAAFGPPGVAGGPQVTVYAAGLDAATAGLVTTSTTCPEAGTHAGNVSGSAAFVPAEAKVAESGFVRSPLDIAQ
jgi:hypothetical protein